MNRIGKDFRKIHYIRYVDKFIVGLDCDLSTAKIVVQNINRFIMDRLKMQLKQQQIVSFKHKQTLFLGFIIKGSAFSNRFIRTNVKGKKYKEVVPCPLILIPMKRILDRLVLKGFIKYNKNGYKPKSLRRLIHNSLYSIIEFYNTIYKSFAYYYKICKFRNTLRSLNYMLKISCALTIALKMNLKTIHKVMQVYGPNLTAVENKVEISFVK